MQTERFNQLRKNELSKIFDKKTLVKVWRDIVKNQLRSLDLKDLFDHYDFNYNIEHRAEAIISEILNGSYKVSQPMIYRLEKKFGVCRHLVIPQPSDALVFQVLIENLSGEILSNQPSKNAFYSRDKHKKSKPYEDIDEYNFNWRKQWKKLQKKIYKFNEEKDLIIVTDLTNYYDSIDINELRKVFTSYSKINEVVIDLVFRIIEEISWKPDYLPYSSRGLPTTNIEGIRLLAHSFLFEIDEVMKEKTNNSFTRWMDDITIGINTKRDAIEILSIISDMLKSRGLALNLSKTNIYDASAAHYQFQIDANRYIDDIEKKITDESLDYDRARVELDERFKNHFEDKASKYWEKIAKRYITLYGKLSCKSLLKDLSKIYVAYPGLRENLIFYLKKIGYGKKTARNVLDIINTIDIFDDRSLYQLCLLVTDWEIPINQKSNSFLKTFEKHIMLFLSKRNNPSDFYSVLWFKTKYNPPIDLLKFIKEYKKRWQTDSFLRRQVTASLSRLLSFQNIEVQLILHNQITSGVPNTVTLANQILLFSDIQKLDYKLKSYLFLENVQRPYPLGKFLVLCSVLNSESIRDNPKVRKKIKKHIRDPYYLKWLESQYGIN